MSQPSDKPNDDGAERRPAGHPPAGDLAPPFWTEVDAEPDCASLDAAPPILAHLVEPAVDLSRLPAVYPLAPPIPEAVGVPRRFSVGVLMILVTLFAVLCAFLSVFLRSGGIEPAAAQRIYMLLLVLFMGVAAGQVLLYQGRQPRAASIWVGAILFPLEILALAIYESNAADAGRHSFAPWIGGLVCAIPGGAMLGYMAGTLTAGIFLFIKSRTKAEEEEEDVSPWVELQPFAVGDIDTLLSWLGSHSLVRRWGQGAFEFPLDRGQIANHLEIAAAANPPVRSFKAVRPDTGQMVGYVELAAIEPAVTRSARIQRALAAPDLSRRGDWSAALISAVLTKAFDELNLHRVDVTAMEFDLDGIACYKKLGFVYEGIMRDAIRCDDYYADLRLMSILEPRWRARPRLGSFWSG